MNGFGVPIPNSIFLWCTYYIHILIIVYFGKRPINLNNGWEKSFRIHYQKYIFSLPLPRSYSTSQNELRSLKSKIHTFASPKISHMQIIFLQKVEYLYSFYFILLHANILATLLCELLLLPLPLPLLSSVYIFQPRKRFFFCGISHLYLLCQK